jgi:hypothetical protein
MRLVLRRAASSTSRTDLPDNVATSNAVYGTIPLWHVLPRNGFGAILPNHVSSITQVQERWRWRWRWRDIQGRISFEEEVVERQGRSDQPRVGGRGERHDAGEADEGAAPDGPFGQVAPRREAVHVHPPPRRHLLLHHPPRVVLGLSVACITSQQATTPYQTSSNSSQHHGPMVPEQRERERESNADATWCVRRWVCSTAPPTRVDEQTLVVAHREARGCSGSPTRSRHKPPPWDGS